MRAIVSIFVIVIVVAIVAVASGFVNLRGNAGALPTVQVAGGKLPSVDANVGSIDVGTTNTSVEVPKVDVGTVKKTVEVPTVAVHKPN